MHYFKLPFSDQIHALEGPEEKNTLAFVSFEGEGQVQFEGSLKSYTKSAILDREFLSSALPLAPVIQEQSKENYQEKLLKTIEVINRWGLEKLVLSRRKVVPYEKLSLTRTFLNLTERYPEAFSYVFFDGKQSWVGAFSELLGQYEHTTKRFKTMSLAGTLPLDSSWGEKEKEEQQAVTRFIQGVLEIHGREIQISETYSHPSGNIKHLRTDFSCLLEPENLETVIQALHPTPAVLGQPKALCLEALKTLEPYPRELYAGYSQLQLGGSHYFFVNLRCAKLFQNEAHLFVGGGITAKSHIETEFEETELKSQAVLSQMALVK